MRSDKLMAKHILVLRGYCLTYPGNAVKAYQAVYPKAGESTARANVSDLLKKDTAQAWISEFLSCIPASERVNANDVYEGFLREARNQENRASDRIRAWELLAKLKGMLRETEINTTILSSDDYTAIRNTVRGIKDKSPIGGSKVDDV